MNKDPNTIDRADICIITFYDESFKKFGDLTWITIHKYAVQHSLDPILFRKALSGRPPAWEKVICIQKALDMGYEFVFWVDADVIIVDNSIDIRSILIDDPSDNDKKDLFMVRHEIDEGLSPNTGILVIRNSARSRKILSDLWNIKEFINHRWWEQAAFIAYFGLINDLPVDQKKLFDGWNRKISHVDSSCIKWIDPRWNYIPHLKLSQGCIQKPPIINHYAGQRWFQRLVGMISDSLKYRYLRFGDERFSYYIIMFCLAKFRILASNLYVTITSFHFLKHLK